ncbi:MAG: alpha/beta hydrolase [Anaerolineae bacterium]|nr:alpha/beta hydrolase [Anaerolineae bacterium]
MEIRSTFRFWLFGAGLVLVVAMSAGGLWWANRVTVQRDVVYGEANGEKLLLDIYRKNLTLDYTLFGPKPAVVMLHGGGWASGSKRELQELGMDLAQQGYVAFSVEYRFVTPNSNPHPTQLDDVQRAVRWIRANAAHYQVDPAHISAAGVSAGAHLAALLGTTDTRVHLDPALTAYSSRVNCVASWYGLFDLTQPFPSTPPNMEEQVTRFVGSNRSNTDAYRKASPITYIDRNNAQFMLIHGELDSTIPISQTRQFAAALQNVSRPPILLTFANEGHGILHSANVTAVRQQFLTFLKGC